MARYWVNLGSWENDKEDRKIERELKMLGDIYLNFNGDLVFKTFDLAEAKRVCKEAREILEKHTLCSDNINISAQPECPNCNNLGKFSDAYCSLCGAKMKREEIDF